MCIGVCPTMKNRRWRETNEKLPLDYPFIWYLLPLIGRLCFLGAIDQRDDFGAPVTGTAIRQVGRMMKAIMKEIWSPGRNDSWRDRSSNASRWIYGLEIGIHTKCGKKSSCKKQSTSNVELNGFCWRGNWIRWNRRLRRRICRSVFDGAEGWLWCCLYR